jgi:hypothetical protein
MLRKFTLALVAAAALGAMALAPTAASAGGGGKGGGSGWKGGGGGDSWHHHNFNHGFGINYIGGGYGDDGCFVTRRVPTPFGYRWRTVNVCGY